MTDEIKQRYWLEEDKLSSKIDWLLGKFYKFDFYVIIQDRIILGIDGFYDRNKEDKECIRQLRIFLPFMYIGRFWGETPSGLSMKTSQYSFGWNFKHNHIA